MNPKTVTFILILAFLAWVGQGQAQSLVWAEAEPTSEPAPGDEPLYPEDLDSSNIYVSLSGSDSTGNGSWSKPYRTMSKAVSEAEPGDTVMVRGGVYTAFKQSITAIGTANQPITVRPYWGETVVLDGTGVSMSGTDSIITLMRAKHLIFEGFEIRNSVGRGLSVYESEYVTVRNNRVHEIRKRGMGGSGNYLIFEGNEIWRTVLENENGAVGEGNGGWAGALATNVWWSTKVPSRHIIMRNNYVHDNWGEGIVPLHAEYVLIENNIVHDTWSMNIYLDNTRYTRVLGNLVYSTNPLYYRPGKGYAATGINMANEGYDWPAVPLEHIVIANNLIVNTGQGIGFWFDASNSMWENSYRHVTVSHNVIYNTQREALSIDAVPSNKRQPSNLILQNNIIYQGQNGRLGWVNNLGAWQIVTNNWPDGVPDFAQGAGNFSDDPRFSNPTIGAGWNGFHIKGDSSSVGAGQPVDNVMTDYRGFIRRNPTSLGVHEFGGIPISDLTERVYLPIVGR